MFYLKELLTQLEEVHSQFTIVPNPPFSEISLFFSKIYNFKLQTDGSLQKWFIYYRKLEEINRIYCFFKKNISFTEKGLKGIVVNRACASLNRKSFENAVTVPLKSGFVLKYIVRPNQTVFAKSVP